MKNKLLPDTNILPKMADGGKTPRDGATKKSDNKGKKIAVYMGDKWHHFGDSSMQDYRQHKSEKHSNLKPHFIKNNQTSQICVYIHLLNSCSLQIQINYIFHLTFKR
jgi:hypothetical protein